MNSRGECRPRRKADLVAESLARQLEQTRLENEAHVTALKILRAKVDRVEELCASREQCDPMFAYLDIDEVRAALNGGAVPDVR